MRYISTILIIAATVFLVRSYNIDAADSTVFSTKEEIKSAQDDFFLSNGTYLQTTKINKLPSDRIGTVKGRLGKDMPSNFYVNVYGGPKGQGYEVVEETDTEIIVTGYGVEASSRTYRITKPQKGIASTTP